MGRLGEVTGGGRTATLARSERVAALSHVRSVAHDERAHRGVRAHLESIALALDCADVALVLSPAEQAGAESGDCPSPLPEREEILLRLSSSPSSPDASVHREPIDLADIGEVGAVVFERPRALLWSPRDRQIAAAGVRALREHLAALSDQQAADDERTRLALAHDVSQALADTRSLDDAIDIVLAVVCRATQGHVAEAWIPDAGVLRRTHFFVREPGLERFALATTSVAIAPGDGAPGEAWSTGECVVDRDLANSLRDERAHAAKAHGLAATFAVPIRSRDETIAVLSFLVRDAAALEPLSVQGVAPVLSALGPTFARIRADAATQSADRSQRMLLESLAQFVVTTDLEGRIASCNDAFLRAVGDARDDVLGADFFLRYTREPRRERLRVWRAVRNRVLEPLEIGLFGADGAWHTMNWHGVVITGHDGHPVGLTAFGADARNCDADGPRRAILADSIDGTDEAIALIDESLRISWANKRFADFIALRREDMIGESVVALSRHHPTHEALRTLLALCEGGARTRREFTQPSADGRTRYLRVTFDPVRDGRGDLMHHLVSLRDVTEERLRERRLQRLSTAVRGLSEGIALTDADGALSEVNDAFAELHGFRSAHDMRGRPWSAWLAPGAADGFVQEVERALLRQGTWTGDVPLRRRDGSEVVARYAMTTLDDEGLAIVAGDQTARIRVERELVRARDIAEATRRAQGNFVSVVSHELRTPLNAIIGFSNIVLKRSAERLDDVDRDYLSRVRSSGTALLSIIDGILTHARAESGELVLQRQPVTVASLVPEALREVASLRRIPNVALRLEIAEGLPPAYVDPQRLTQMIAHLLSNAYKFTRHGEVRLTVQAEGDGAQSITVSDTGIGISPDRLESVWTPFEQGDSGTSRHYGGTGLGLTIVRSLARLMGLQLEASSRLGEGSIFTVRIPATWVTSRFAPREPEKGACNVEETPEIATDGSLKKF